MHIASRHSFDPLQRRPPVAPRNLLIVDDSRAQRRILTALMMRRGYHVREAGSAEEALDLCRLHRFDIVISDWMMPGMSGPEFCAAFRALPRESYGYFILLTSRDDRAEAAHGLDLGADDFLSKPVDSQELYARVAAGERILRMERELTEKNRLIAATLSRLQTVHDALDRDLREARKLQQSLVRKRYQHFRSGQASLLLRPNGHVGGDLVGFFPIDATRLGMFAIDVSGHGVTSAIMTARLAGVLSGASPDQNIAMETGIGGRRRGLPPEEVAAALNDLMLNEIQTDQYLTLLYAVINLQTGDVDLVQAGHPRPAVQRSDGPVEFLGDGGLPVGLIADARFDRITTRLGPGDRLLIASDGITECTDPRGAQFDEPGVAACLARHSDLRGQMFLDALVQDLQDHSGAPDFTDDVSAALFEMHPRPS
ncbi:MAG: fused response regulator/phosphatase [Paracoccaceae bacterium]|nr:fused response regulator/phosphatase [Paracoccaceae bacterium]